MRKNLLHALALTIPMVIFYLGYLFYHTDNIQPTGYIQYDNASYVAYGKQYLDADHFHLQYSNPFNESDEYKPIYFQTQSIFFAFLLKLGIPPGWVLIPFSFICAVICFLLVIKIYDFLVPDKKYRTFNTWLFAWGGGLLVVAGMIAHFIVKRYAHVSDDFFLVDPEEGWWGLSLGRALFFSCEAYYHALFLGCIYCLLKRKWIIAIVLLFVLSASHPFTGIELIGIVCVWCAFEFFFTKKEIPLWFCVAAVAILCLHLYYYLIYLEQFPDHRSVSEQYTLKWRLRLFRMVPAYCIVGALTIASIYNATVKNFLQVRSNRIFLCWFFIAFLLANHEVFMTARQPIHFTRGYIWTSLFLLGLPALQRFNYFLQKRFGKIALAFFAVVFLFDNFLWVFRITYLKADNPSAVYITSEQKNILERLDKESSNKTLIISNDNPMAYLCIVYTKAYPWYSHRYTTPFAEKKLEIQDKFFTEGKFDSAWINREINFILQRSDSIALSTITALHANKIFETAHYLIYKYNPIKP